MAAKEKSPMFLVDVADLTDEQVHELAERIWDALSRPPAPGPPEKAVQVPRRGGAPRRRCGRK